MIIGVATEKSHSDYNFHRVGCLFYTMATPIITLTLTTPLINLSIVTQCPSRALNVSTTLATGFRYNNKCLGRLAIHIWEPYTHKQNLVGPVGIEPTPSVSKTKMISISLRAEILGAPCWNRTNFNTASRYRYNHIS